MICAASFHRASRLVSINDTVAKCPKLDTQHLQKTGQHGLPLSTFLEMLKKHAHKTQTRNPQAPNRNHQFQTPTNPAKAPLQTLTWRSMCVVVAWTTRLLNKDMELASTLWLLLKWCIICRASEALMPLLAFGFGS